MLTWETRCSVLYLAAQVAVSPPPMIVTAPVWGVKMTLVVGQLATQFVNYPALASCPVLLTRLY